MQNQCSVRHLLTSVLTTTAKFHCFLSTVSDKSNKLVSSEHQQTAEDELLFKKFKDIYRIIYWWVAWFMVGSHQRTCYIPGPVCTGMGNRIQVQLRLLENLSQYVARSTQPGHPFVSRRCEYDYQPMGVDACGWKVEADIARLW